MTDYNWLTPKAQARPAGSKGWGSFVTEPIRAGETVACFGGWVMTEAMLGDLPHDRQSRSIQIDTDLYLVSAPTPEAGIPASPPSRVAATAPESPALARM